MTYFNVERTMYNLNTNVNILYNMSTTKNIKYFNFTGNFHLLASEMYNE